MTTTKVCCDGCGKGYSSPSEGWLEGTCACSELRHTSEGVEPVQRVFCPDCWKKMKEALKDVEP